MRRPLSKSLAAIVLSGMASLAAASSNYTWQSVVIGGGGFVDGIVFHPTVKGLMYARTDMGGAYRWNASSQSWLPLTDWIGSTSDNMGILSIALDPNDGSKVYLLTGKYSNSWTGNNGNVLVSSDTGKTFTATPLHLKNGGNMDGRDAGERLAVDPNLGSILYLAGSDWDTCNNGTYVSTFRGALWKSTNSGASFDSVTTLPKGNGLFVLFDSATGTKGSATKTIYVSMDSSNSGAPAIWKSTDAGATWNVVPGTPSGYLATSGNISGHYAFFSFNNALGPNGITSGKVMRLNTVTGTWTDVSPVASAAFGFGTVSIDRQDPARMVVSSMDKWSTDDDVWLTRDTGATWTTRLSTGTMDLSFSPWKSVRTPHWLASVQIDPFDSTMALFGTGYGVFRTDDLLAASPTWVASDSNLEETVAQQVLVPPSGSAVLYSALGDQGGFRHTSLTKAPSSVYLPDLGTTLAIDVAWSKLNVLVKAHNSANSAGTYGSYSIDSGKTWTGFASEPSGVSSTNGGGTRSIAVNASGTTILWTAPGSSGPYYSTDNGTTWKASTSPSITVGTAWPVADRVNASKMYVLDPQSGTLLYSTNAGATFTAGGTFLTLSDWEAGNAAVVAVPGYEGTLLVASSHAWSDAGNGLYLSTNSGATLTHLTTVASATQVAVGKAAPGKTFPAIFINGTVGGATGFFRSDDSAKTWTQINDAQHQYGTIHHIAGDMNTYGRLFVGTEGRGIVYGQPTGTVSTGIDAAPAVRLQSLQRLGNRIVSPTGASIVLYDLGGRAVRHGDASGLDLSGLPRGLYLAHGGTSSLRVSLTE
jgi:hypothetical protein